MQNCVCHVLILDEASRTLASITRLKSQLSDFIEPDFGLLDLLLSLGVLTSRQYDKVRTGYRVKYERCDALLDLLTTEDQCDKFLKALQRTGQQHVVNFVTHNGGQNDNHFTSYTNVKNGVRQRRRFLPGSWVRTRPLLRPIGSIP